MILEAGGDYPLPKESEIAFHGFEDGLNFFSLVNSSNPNIAMWYCLGLSQENWVILVNGMTIIPTNLALFILVV
ncbi:hypothetical protein [Microbulbifer sp. SSSA005]|uniref:hypothetical protein n=1 Tax=Microbulbifer sp. SSSA005 TaxID=3243378 RepID=UPI00403925D2